MAFSINTEKRSNINFLILKNDDTQEYMEIMPEIGGTVNKICLSIDNTPQNILLTDPDDEIIEYKLHKSRMLFPFNDIIPGGKYVYNGTEHQLDTSKRSDGNAKHGFIKFEGLDIVEQKTEANQCSVTLGLTMKEDQFMGYPFAVNLLITYILMEKKVRLEFKLENKGTQTAPVTLGWHPYFTFNNSLEEITLKADIPEYYELDADDMPTGTLIPCTGTDFDFTMGRTIADLNVDNAFVVPADGKVILTKGGNTIEYYQDPTVFKVTQLFIPPIKSAIAVEPLTAAANAFIKPDALNLLEIKPGQVITTHAEVKVY